MGAPLPRRASGRQPLALAAPTGRSCSGHSQSNRYWSACSKERHSSAKNDKPSFDSKQEVRLKQKVMWHTRKKKERERKPSKGGKLESMHFLVDRKISQDRRTGARAALATKPVGSAHFYCLLNLRGVCLPGEGTEGTRKPSLPMAPSQVIFHC